MYDEKKFFLSIGVNDRKPRRLGVERSLVYINDQPYLKRFIAYLLGWTLRVHKFYRGDDERAPHTHPFWFITLPFKDYVEGVYNHGTFLGYNVVKAWRFHYRAADYEHIVIGRADGKTEPFWTFVISKKVDAKWGFYPIPGEFVYWRDFK